MGLEDGETPGCSSKSADNSEGNIQQPANSDVFDSLQLSEDPTEPEISSSPPLNYKRSREKQKHSGYLPQCKRSAPGCSKNANKSITNDQLIDGDPDGPQAAKFKRRSEAANFESEENSDASRSNFESDAAYGVDDLTHNKFVPTEFTRTSENYGDLEGGELVVAEESDEDGAEDADAEDLDEEVEQLASANGQRRVQKQPDHYAMYFDDTSAGEEEQFEAHSDANEHEGDGQMLAVVNQPVFEDSLDEPVVVDREAIEAILEVNNKRNAQKANSAFDGNASRGPPGSSGMVGSNGRHQPPTTFTTGFSNGASACRSSNMTGSFHSGLRARVAPSQQLLGPGYHHSPDERSVGFPTQPAPPSAYGRGVRYSAASVGGNLNFNNVGLNNNNGTNSYQNVQPGPSARRRPIAPVDVHVFDHPGLPPLNVAAVARGVATGSPNNPNPLHNWQATKSCLKDRFSFMFNNEILSDVHFLVGRGDQRQRIPAHKFVLSVGSAVFDAMFNGHMAATEQSDIELPDVEPVAFLALLKFLYTDEYTFGPESVMTTLYTAKKYAVPSLENACVDFLKKNLSYDNAFMLLTQARLFDEPQLAALCLEMIDKHTPEAIGAEGFTDIDLETLCVVLERDTLRIREAALFAAVVRWSTEECHRQQKPVTSENQRQVLGRALSLIRFPLMTVEEFAQNAAQLGILTDREVVNLFLYFTVNPKPSVGFFDSPRCSVTGKEQVVNRFQRIEGRWGYSGTPDRIKFTVDRRIFIVGFGLFGSIHGPTEYQVNIQIIHCGTGKVIGSNDTSFQCDGSASTFRVMFKESVEVSPCITYIASATLKGPDSHYGTKGLRRIVHQSAGAGGMVTFQFTYAAGNNNGTSVEDGQIPEIIFYTKASS